MRKRITIKIFGNVIGVTFRQHTWELARELGLTGYVRNCPDETVEIVAEGEEEKLNKLTSWAEKGPRWARIRQVKSNLKEVTGEFERFEIRY